MKNLITVFLALIMLAGVVSFFVYFPQMIFVLLPFSLLGILIGVVCCIYIINRVRWAIITRPKKTAVHELSPPDGLRPIELGFLYDQKTSTNEIASILFYLIYKKHIHLIVEKPKHNLTKGEYILIKNDTDDSSLRKYEKTFLEKLFNENSKVLWSDFNDSYSSGLNLSIITFEVMQELQQQGYYYFSDNYLNQTYDEAISDAVSNFRFNIFRNTVRFILNVGLGISKYCTSKGMTILPEIVGFRKYIEVAERERVKFHIDPNRELYVDEFAPYAIAFGVSKRWGDELMGMEFIKGE